MRLLILTTDPTLQKWGSVKKKLQIIDNALNSGKNANFDTTEVKYVDVKPKVVNSRISHAWLEELKAPYFRQGYDIIGLHTSEDQWDGWGLESNLRGANPIRNIELGDFYFNADENSKRGRFDRFVQVAIHEIKHEYHQQTGTPDDTHDLHGQKNDIIPHMEKLDWSLYQPARIGLRNILNTTQKAFISLLRSTVNALIKKGGVKDLHPLVKRKANAIIVDMAAQGHAVRIVEGYRSPQRQQELYNQGRTTPGNIVTNAKPGESLHQYGVAVDFVFRKEGYNVSQAQWKLLGTVGKSHGFEWGGDWKGFVDRPHFEMTLGYSLESFQQGKVDYSKWA